MISRDQIIAFARKEKTNESTVFREYLQTIFLRTLYEQKGSEHIFFKGGTAVHLMFQAPRFSEDLDFTVMMNEKAFTPFISSVFKNIAQEEEVTFKPRKTIVGKRFLLTAKPQNMQFATFINLDFSFREKVLQPMESILDSPYPIIITSFIHHLSPSEICAEKVRALLTRHKGRDLFDLWFLLSKGVALDRDMITKKIAHYQLSGDQFPTLIQRIKKYTKQEFIVDLRPFVKAGERSSLGERFDYIQAYLIKKISEFHIS